jgi:hypothetical protein
MPLEHEGVLNWEGVGEDDVGRVQPRTRGRKIRSTISTSVASGTDAWVYRWTLCATN